ncbi:Gfo/Idh/MocA family protein [Chloroflexota bacterium]
MDNAKNIAVVGCGYWGKNLIRNFAELETLHTICDADSQKLDSFKLLYPGLNAETDYLQVLRNDEIKGVVIATPAVLHYSMAKKALLAGKDIFVEKPFTTKSQEAQELVELSEKQERVLIVGHLLLYHPAVQKLKDFIQSGELGEIYHLYSTRINLGQIRQDENALWRLVPHDIAMFIYLLEDSPVVVSAQGGTYLQPNFVDIVFVTLRFGKIMAHVHASWLDPHKIRQLTVIGSKKMATFDDMEPEDKLKIYDKGVVTDCDTESPFSGAFVLRSEEVFSPQVDLTEPLRLECLEFIKCMRDRKKPISDAKLGLKVVEALETADKLMQEEKKTTNVTGRNG